MATTPIKRSVAITAIAASTLGGVAAGAAFFTPVIAGAQDDAVETEQVAPEPGSRISEALQVLVDDGTLTEAQRDAVVEALQNARPERGESRERLGERSPRGGAGAIAEILGLEGNEIREALRNGSSIAELAEAQGIDSADIVDAIVAQNEERLAAAVENGRIDDAQAAEMLTQATERAEDLVNGEIEFGGRRGHRRGFGGPGGDAAVDTEASA